MSIIPPHKAALLALVSSVLLSACGSSGSSNDTVSDNFICSAMSATASAAVTQSSPAVSTTASGYTLSGQLTVSASVAVDSDINDIAADYSSNDSPESCQVISNTVTLQGFASKVPTYARLSNDASLERYASSSDNDDWYGVSLQAGQTIRLQIVDYTSSTYSGYSGDLDLYVYAADDVNTPLYSSSTYSETDEVTVAATGSYLINVHAYAGISKYVLQFLSASTQAAVSPTPVMDDFVANQMIIRMSGSSTTASAMMTAAGIQASVSKVKQSAPDRPSLMTISRSEAQLQALAGNSKTDPLRAFSEIAYNKRQTLIDIKTMTLQDGVEYAEPNYIRKPLTTPNDTYYSYQWHYPQINLPQAWDISTGTPASGDVVVAVIDTGMYLDHPDLDDKISADGGYDFISATSISNDGDGIDNDPDDPGDSTNLSESSWHGTHVAGTIAAESNNGTGVAGVSWGAKVMPLRALGVGGGTSYDIMQALYYAAGLANDSGTTPYQKAEIINLSLGGESYSSSEQVAYTAARNAGVIIVAAAGNAATSTLYYPASYDGVISVSATGYNDELTSYSNYGSKIDIAAPGGDTSVDDNGDGYNDGVLSTYVSVNNATGTRSAAYQRLAGTSMATPHVAGVLALMKAVYPSLTPDQIDTLISTCSITNKAGDSSCARDNQLGYGRIDAYAAVSAAYSLANGGSLPSMPVVLESTPSSLSIGSASSLNFVLSNSGGGSPVVSSVVSADDWLSISASDVDAYGFGTYTASADRTGLNDGYYSTTVTVSADDGSSLSIAAYITVGSVSSAGEMTQQYVLLLDANNPSDVISSIYASADGRYQFSNIPSGSYLLTAGSDIDVDMYVCQSGETCGEYPTLNSPETLEVSSDISNLNFQVSVMSSFGSNETTSTAASTQHEPVARPATTTDESGRAASKAVAE